MNDYYDENEYENEEDNEQEIQEYHARKVSSRLLTIIQITVCCIILLTMFLLRVSGSNAYSMIRGWYVKSINQTIVPDEQIQNIKHNVIALFPAVSNAPAAASSSQAGAAASQQSAGAQSNTASKQASSQPNNTASQQSAVQPNSQQAANSQSAGSLPPVESQKLIG